MSCNIGSALTSSIISCFAYSSTSGLSSDGRTLGRPLNNVRGSSAPSTTSPPPSDAEDLEPVCAVECMTEPPVWGVAPMLALRAMLLPPPDWCCFRTVEVEAAAGCLRADGELRPPPMPAATVAPMLRRATRSRRTSVRTASAYLRWRK